MSNMIVEENGASVATFDKVEAVIAEFKKEHVDKVYDVTTTAGLKQAKAARAVYRSARVDVEKVRVSRKRFFLEGGRKVDADAKRLTAACVEFEQPLADLIKAEDDRKAAEKAERERIERERVEGIQNEINGLHFTLSEHHPSEEIAERLAELESVIVDGRFGEFQEQANSALDKAEGDCRNALVVAEKREADAKLEAEMREQREARRKAEQEVEAKQQAERDAKIKAEQEAENKRLAEEKAKLDAERKEQERVKAEADAKIAAEQKKIDDEREALAKEKADAEAKRLANEKAEADSKAEAERLANDKAAWDKLVAESKYDTQEKALWQIGALAIMPPADLQTAMSLLRDIRAICVANTEAS